MIILKIKYIIYNILILYMSTTKKFNKSCNFLNNSNTFGTIITTGGNIGIGTANPEYLVDISGSSRITTSLTTGALYSTNVTSTNIVATNLTAANVLFTNNVNALAAIGANTFNANDRYYSSLSTTTRASFFGNWPDSGYWGIGRDPNLASTVKIGRCDGLGRWNGECGVYVSYLTKGSGTFDIKHPIDTTKRLIHSFIEGPRCELIYRGTVKLLNGQATVNIDRDCVEELNCRMTEGTFEALCRNPVKYLHNNDSFSRIRGSINKNILTIICEDVNSTDSIDWMIIAERNDPFIRQWNRTNENGYLQTEYQTSTNNT
jgi:hypothetical protein